MAVASLLRMADTDLRDAAVLAAGRSPVNAPALAGQAVARMVDAVAATEVGWIGEPSGGLAAVPDVNPLRSELAALEKRLPRLGLPAPLRDGRPEGMPDRDALRDGVAAARALLRNLAIRFGVDLAGTGPAGNASPVRPEPKQDATPRLEAPRPAPVAAAALATAKASPRSSGPAKNAVERRPRSPPIARAKVLPVDAGRRRVAGVSPALSREVERRAEVAPRPGPGSVSSSAFWSLMDRWQVADSQALELLGHASGLTKKGTRPRFKLAGGEVDAFLGLQEIDTALVPLKLDPGRWLHEVRKEGPFGGATPLAYLTQARSDGIRAAIRFLLQSGLRLSMSQ